MTSTWEEVDQEGFFLGWKVMLHGNGRWVVYNHEENVYKIETVGGIPVQLTATGRDSYPHWGRVNDKIVYYEHRWSNFDIYVYVVP